MKELILVFGLCMLTGINSQKTTKICAEPNAEQLEWKQHCQAYLTDNWNEQDQFELHCKIISVLESVNNVGLYSILKLTSKEIDHSDHSNNQQSSDTKCLSLTDIQLKKFNPSETSNFDKTARRGNVAKEILESLSIVREIDVEVKLETDSVIGGLIIDSNCVRDQKLKKSRDWNNNNYLNVSTCVSNVKLNDFSTTSPSVNNFQNRAGFSLNFITDQFGLKDVSAVFRSVKCSFNSGNDLLRAKKAMELFGQYSIENLYLKNAGTEELKNDYFPQMSTLQLLDLSECNLRNIEKNAFKPLPNLIHLNLASNKFRNVPNAIFESNQLETLNLSSIGGQFLIEDLKSLNGLRNLKNLDLSGTKIQVNFQNPQSMLTQLELPNLKVLNLSDVGFNPLFADRLKFSELETLILSRNALNDNLMGQLLSTTWNLLQTLDLSENLFSEKFEVNSVLTTYSNLKHLDLAQNKFRQFPSLKLDHFQNAIYLNFSRNNIESWTTSKIDIDPRNVNLTIDLSNNSLTEVNSMMLSDLSKADSVFLRGNDFNCESPSFQAFQKWLIANRQKTDYDKLNHKCFKSSASAHQLQWLLLIFALAISIFVKIN